MEVQQSQLYDPVEINCDSSESKLNFEDITKKKKLVLIQAPKDLNIKSLTGQKFILEGHQNLPADENIVEDRRYELRSSMNCRKNMKSYSVIVPSFDHRKYYISRPIQGSIVIHQTIKIPPVNLPAKEETILPEVPNRLLHKWVPFGAGEPIKKEKPKKSRKRRQVESDQQRKEDSFKILSSMTDSYESEKKEKSKKRKKLKSEKYLKNDEIEIDKESKKIKTKKQKLN